MADQKSRSQQRREKALRDAKQDAPAQPSQEQGRYPGASESNNPASVGHNRPTTPEGGNNGEQ